MASIMANIDIEVQACEYVHTKWNGGLTANLINFLYQQMMCQALIPSQEKCSFRSLRVNQITGNCDGTHQTNA